MRREFYSEEFRSLPALRGFRGATLQGDDALLADVARDGANRRQAAVFIGLQRGDCAVAAELDVQEPSAAGCCEIYRVRADGTGRRLERRVPAGVNPKRADAAA